MTAGLVGGETWEGLTRRAADVDLAAAEAGLLARGEGPEAALSALALHAYVALRERQHAAALTSAVPAERLAFELGHDLTRAEMLRVQASAHFRAGTLAAAAGALLQEVSARKALGDESGELRTLSNLGLLYSEMDDQHKARAILERAAVLAERGGDERAIINVDYNLAQLLVALGDAEGALARLGDVAARARAASMRQIELYALIAEADARNLLGSWEQACALAATAFDGAQQGGERALEGLAHATLGKGRLIGGLVASALTSLHAALKIALELDAISERRSAHRDLSAAYELAGQPSLALSHFRSYHDLDKTMNSQATAHQVGMLSAQLEKEVFRREAEEARTRVVDLQREQRQLTRAVRRDPLTGLGNRILFEERLSAALEDARQQGGRVVLINVDLDGFKAINDTLGHSAGDEVLRGVARTLKSALRAGDTAARLGGDEFAAVLTAVTDVRAAVFVAEKLATLIQRDMNGLPISASVGVASWPDHALSAEQLIERADDAMYAAKRAGKNGVRVAESA